MQTLQERLRVGYLSGEKVKRSIAKKVSKAARQRIEKRPTDKNV